MRIALMVIGLVLLVGGVAVFLGKLDYPHDKEVLKVGNLSATVTEHRTIPQWVGGLSALVGIGLLAAGAMRKR